MILATEQDVVDRLRRDLSETEVENVDTVLEEASIIVESYLAQRGITLSEDEIPPIVVLVVSRMAARALTVTPGGPEFMGSMQAGPYSAQLSEAYSSAAYLSKRDKEMLGELTGSAVSVRLLSDRGYPSA